METSTSLTGRNYLLSFLSHLNSGETNTFIIAMSFHTYRLYRPTSHDSRRRESVIRTKNFDKTVYCNSYQCLSLLMGVPCTSRMLFASNAHTYLRCNGSKVSTYLKSRLLRFLEFSISCVTSLATSNVLPKFPRNNQNRNAASEGYTSFRRIFRHRLGVPFSRLERNEHIYR